LAVHLEWLLTQLEPKRDAVLALIDSGVKADFFCFSSGFTALPPSLPKGIRNRAAALRIEIGIDHYPRSTGPPRA